MVTHPGFDPQASVADAVQIARTARGATLGWRAICVRAQRALGRELVAPLAELDLDDEIPRLAQRVRAIVAGAPSDIDALVFEIFDVVDDVHGPVTGFELSAHRDFDPGVRWLGPPAWCPESAALTSRSLDALARVAAGLRGDLRLAAMRFLRFGAASLLGRFAAQDLPYRVAVAFESGDFAEVTEARPSSIPNVTPPLLTRI